MPSSLPRPALASSTLRPRISVPALVHVVTTLASVARARPFNRAIDTGDEELGPSIWVLGLASVLLVLLGGAFAGLTIAFMGQDSIYLQVLAGDSKELQSENARRVYNLLKRGKHWVLVTLLLSNVIVNETLPVVLDRCLEGGVAAVIGSTILIVIFGEILPQSICVRYGLPIGGIMANPVLLLMYLTAPITWPIARLLDWVLGEDHGTVYKKSGLKTLVGLHRSLGTVDERLNEDEVTIISAVLDLKGKPVGTVMTPMEDVFIMSEDTVLDERTMAQILSEGYSRIPIHATDAPTNFVGMLLVKILITYDPEDCKSVKEFPLATLPETRPETSCLDIVNFFQEGKSHMVLVSECPGEDHGALGVLTLEDVIEELIGEEIIDESDVYIDVHKAIRRLTPAPKARAPKSPRPNDVATFDVPAEVEVCDADGRPFSSSPTRTTTFMMRKSSVDPNGHPIVHKVPVKANLDDMKHSLRRLGPSNPAINPKNTRSTLVKIKHGTGAPIPLPELQLQLPATASTIGLVKEDDAVDSDLEPDERTALLGQQSSGRVALLQSSSQGYTLEAVSQSPLGAADQLVSLGFDVEQNGSSDVDMTGQTTIAVGKMPDVSQPRLADLSPHSSASSTKSSTYWAVRGDPAPHARSGSLTESVVRTGDVQKIVIQTFAAPQDIVGMEVTGLGVDPREEGKQSSLVGRSCLDPSITH